MNCRGILMGGLASQQIPQGLSVRVRLLLIGPRAGMRVTHASLPRFRALRRDNTPTPACLSISGTGLLLELYLRSVPLASGLVYAYEHKCVLGRGWMDGGMCALYRHGKLSM